MTTKISNGILHEVPGDMQKALASDADILVKWNNLTPIQRNEWICWVTIVKKAETRAEHIDRMVEELKEGERQACCWPGCPHRRHAAQKWFKNLICENKMSTETQAYNNKLSSDDKAICDLLFQEINKHLRKAENKIWHGHPVWFLDGNPIVGYSKQKKGIRLMFWSGGSFDEDGLTIRGEKFKDASVFYNNTDEINTKNLKRWLGKSEKIQWDYKNIVKRKGKLIRLK